MLVVAVRAPIAVRGTGGRGSALFAAGGQGHLVVAQLRCTHVCADSPPTHATATAA